jgi:cytochrome c553
MFNLFKSLVNGSAFPRIADLERAYLNASVTPYDLERRQREVENGLFRRSSFDL